MASRKSEPGTLVLDTADVLVIGGGPAGAWAALSAALAGCRVSLVDKGFFGTSGATAPSNTGTWCVPPGESRRAAIEQRAPKTAGLADQRRVEWTLAAAYEGLLELVGRGYPFPLDAKGAPYIANLRGPDYMRFMRREAKAAGVRVLDHHPVLELLSDGDGIGAAAGIDRQRNTPWRITAAAVVLATGGCAFGERMLGATGLTGDGYLMAAQAGARLSGMEFCSQYGIAPAHTSLNKGLIYRWATFTDAAGRPLEGSGDRHTMIAKNLLQGPVFAQLDLADAGMQDLLRRAQPNCFLPFDRQGIDPFAERFEVTLRCEGTVRGVGGIWLAGDDGETGIPGLFAAGDVASREPVNGAISGGGGPNASWAIASGKAAGRAAARYALAQGATAGRRYPERLSLARAPARGHDLDRPSAEVVAAAVRDEMLPLDKNFFRSETTLAASAARLDALSEQLRDGFGGAIAQPLREHEASALLASARWSIAAARLRGESRGMHRRLDVPEQRTAFARRIEVGGVERPRAVWASSMDAIQASGPSGATAAIETGVLA
jgi:succinate dehydrogenase/fumarate reductase flavoprotein subunit